MNGEVQHYGQCVYEAPNIIQFNSEDKLEYIATAVDAELSMLKRLPMSALCKPSYDPFT